MKGHEDVYRAFFEESFEALASDIERCRIGNERDSDIDWKIRHEMHLFDPVARGSLYDTYDRMVELTQRRMASCLEGLMRSMLDADGRGYTVGEAVQHPNGFLWREVPLVITVNGRKTGLVFSGTSRIPPQLSCASSYDELLIVIATRTKNGLHSRNIYQGVRRISLEELFEILFPGEYESFLNHVDIFNEKVEELIAFSLIERPTEERMPEVRAECLKRLRSDVESMRSDLTAGVYLRDWEGRPVLTGPNLSKQVDRLYRRFLDDGVCEVMIGKMCMKHRYPVAHTHNRCHEKIRGLRKGTMCV